MLRVKEAPVKRLRALNEVKQKQSYKAKSQRGEEIDIPVHLLLFIDSSYTIDTNFERTQYSMQEGTVASEYQIEMGSKWFGRKEQDTTEQYPLEESSITVPACHL
jgi:hypothetical protein